MDPRGSDQVVVADRAAMGVELFAFLEDHGELAALGIGELNAIADDERAGCGHGEVFPSCSPSGGRRRGCGCPDEIVTGVA